MREALEREGVFRFPLRGASMRPTLPVECDIEIVPLPAQTPLGALIVFVIDDTLIAHRLVRRSGGRWIAQGDGRLGPDRPLAPSQILGMVVGGASGRTSLLADGSFPRVDGVLGGPVLGAAAGAGHAAGFARHPPRPSDPTA